MSTFDSTKIPLKQLLDEIYSGNIQLPDFQRGWVWDDEHIRSLLISVARSFPIGAVMFLETGGQVQLQTRPIEGLEQIIPADKKPERLVLDGQQRLTTLTQVIKISDRPVQTTTPNGKKIQRYYYFDINKVLALGDNLQNLEEAVIAVDHDKKLRTNFARDVQLDLSTTEKECLAFYFPCTQIMNSDSWEYKLQEVAPDKFGAYMKFRQKVLESFRSYQLPVIQLHKETSKEAVCLVFEKVNTGGVPLTVFELVTASYAAEGFNLRDDWYGSKARGIPSREQRLAKNPLLEKIDPNDFLLVLTVLYTHERKNGDIQAGRTGKEIRPISAKRTEILNLPLKFYKDNAERVEKGFQLAAQFLKKESIYSIRELPYKTQIIPLAAVMTHIGDRWLEPKIYDKLACWYWCGVLGELYRGAVETRMALDYEDLLEWIGNEQNVPRTVKDATFHASRLETMSSRLSAAYKGINILIIREGARDWYWKASIKELDLDKVKLDIHHIFPKDWCKRNGFHSKTYNSILNKTILSYKANRKIGKYAPSHYLAQIQKEKHVQLNDDDMNSILETHALSPQMLRKDSFKEFLEDRKRRLCEMISRAMGKAVSQEQEDAVNEADEGENQD